MSLNGKTMFISGASRGIGLEIAKRVAQDGANVALIAKTDQPNPKLPGTIHTAAAEIEAAGGKALAIAGDIDEAQVQAAAKRAADHFGGIDILVNNASDLAHRHARDADEALRSHVRRQRPRHLLLLAGLPAGLKQAATRTSSRSRRRST